MNNKIIKIFKELLEYNKNLENPYKIRAYENALKNIVNFDKKITKKNINEIPGIGKKSRDKISEIVTTGRLKGHKKSMKLLSQIIDIPGFGIKYAKKIIDKIDNINDIKKLDLNNAQKIGFKYKDKIMKKIPRNATLDIIGEIMTDNPKYEIIPAGSYRREKKYLGDLDIIAIRPKTEQKFQLPKKAIILSEGKKKIMMLCKLKNKYIQVDIRIFDEINKIPAIIYFTGSKVFNVKLRGKAKQLGYKLNEYELSKDGKKIDIRSEQELFKKLGLEYVPPNMRE